MVTIQLKGVSWIFFECELHVDRANFIAKNFTCNHTLQLYRLIQAFSKTFIKLRIDCHNPFRESEASHIIRNLSMLRY